MQVVWTCRALPALHGCRMGVSQVRLALCPGGTLVQVASHFATLGHCTAAAAAYLCHLSHPIPLQGAPVHILHLFGL